MNFTFKRSYRGPLKAAILDWAGTTVDYGCRAPVRVFVEVFKRRGVEVSEGQAREPMGLHKRDHIRILSKMEPVSRQWTARHGKECGEEDIEAMFRDFIPLQLSCLAEYADLTPGTLEAVAEMKRRGMKIGTTTGYNREMLAMLLAESKQRGYVPDSSFCPEDVPSGRPAPWMCFRNAMELQIFPMEAWVKIGDTLSDIAEGLNAGMWTIGVTKVGNEIGLSPEEVARLAPEELNRRLAAAAHRFVHAGAHYVVEDLGQVPPLLDQIEARLAHGERP